ncbi:hypothetical protein HHK36_025358 [Tetracentron sinense]|uniref:RBR-type E3 ubiquitin transferase n=1 Tax=Tetracentron sinense TaxID=13715 RepID=A0A835D324_TETSI|nr:hypothetical protein HHK36_025358 [Tetracentron sinense]
MAETSGPNILVDDFYFSVLSDEREIFPISDEKYAEGLQLQEALMSSVIASQLPNGSSEMEETPMKILKLVRKDGGESSQMANGSSEMKILKLVRKDVGESSQSFCEICLEGKPTEDMFRNTITCSHSFCVDCISKYVAAKIQENINMVKCPDFHCKGLLEPDRCRSILPEEVFDRWDKALCESLILASQRFYCPFKDCSAILVDEGGELVTASECPYCRRLFCAQCNVSWHAGIGCDEFQRLHEDDRKIEDLMVIELAKEKKWMRCPKCEFYVEKRDGCVHISCRCGFQFCYGCGLGWTETHGAVCQMN